MTVESFWQENWQQRPLFIKRGAGSSTFFDAFPIVHGTDLQDVLATCRSHVGRNGQLATDWKIVKQELRPDGAARAGDAPPFATGPCAGEKKVLEDQWCRAAHAADAFAKGFSLVINMVQDKAPRALQLVEGFQRETGMLTSVNLYWSPMGSQAFDIHYDIREVFALQIEGTKHWKLYEPAIMHPRSDMEKLDVTAMRNQEPSLDFIMEPGDLLYIPAGLVHLADTTHVAPEAAPPSLHLTVGVECLSQIGSWEALLLDLIARAMADRPEAAGFRCKKQEEEEEEWDARTLGEVLAAPVPQEGLPLRWGELLAALLVHAATLPGRASGLRTSVPVAPSAVQAAGGPRPVIARVGEMAALFRETADVAAAARHVVGANGGKLRRRPVPDSDKLGAALFERVEAVLKDASAQQALLRLDASSSSFGPELRRVLAHLECCLREPGNGAQALGVYDGVRQRSLEDRRQHQVKLLHVAARDWERWRARVQSAQQAEL